jgi:hypothetical protein
MKDGMGLAAIEFGWDPKGTQLLVGFLTRLLAPGYEGLVIALGNNAEDAVEWNLGDWQSGGSAGLGYGGTLRPYEGESTLTFPVWSIAPRNERECYQADATLHVLASIAMDFEARVFEPCGDVLQVPIRVTEVVFAPELGSGFQPCGLVYPVVAELLERYDKYRIQDKYGVRIPQASKAMNDFQRKLSVDCLDESDTGAFTDCTRLVFRVPGPNSGIYTAHPFDANPTEPIAFDTHNIDFATQPLVILAGIGAICDEVRNSI